ncbi:GerW family sporulation protein [Paenibacillus sp. N1-5-1-14]|uniref:GerW family sporulation protein n=1 Tax=Paenibacillus radicibacter TaxID=2972488 RepID=UPI0021599091|nr:GerW family sporulation protein [Paenibacillus radicibacter]MCR8642342.1 GerW family sporulation protein [Paenibacillus radicibacter]
MSEHPIQGLMKTAMENIKAMVDVNTIVGDPVETPDGSVIMPISKIGFGFAAGGSEFVPYSEDDNQGGNSNSNQQQGGSSSGQYPFGGGSGGGISITPIAFLVVSKCGVNVLSLERHTHILERIIDTTPTIIDKVQQMMSSGGSSSNSSSSDASSSSNSNNKHH